MLKEALEELGGLGSGIGSLLLVVDLGGDSRGKNRVDCSQVAAWEQCEEEVYAPSPEPRARGVDENERAAVNAAERKTRGRAA